VKVVLDSNVLVAGLAFSGICRAIVDVCIDSHHLVLSELFCWKSIARWCTSSVIPPRWQMNAFRSCGKPLKSLCRRKSNPMPAATQTTFRCWALYRQAALIAW